jgi:Cu(I)/Ag(I) efflux system membrane fusion protein
VGNIDMSALRENMKVHVEIVKTDMPMFTVNAIHVMSEIKLGADEEMLIPLDHLGHAQ